MSTPTKTLLPPPPTDAEVLDAALRHRAGYLPEGWTLASLHTSLGESSTSIPEGCAGLLAPSFERCGHVLLGRDAEGHAVMPAGGLSGDTIVHRGATGTGKTHLAQRVADAALGAEDPMRVIVVTPRRTLAHELGRRLKLPCYLDLDPRSPEWAGSLVVSPMSLHKVVSFDREGALVGGPLVVILDESEMIARDFATDLWKGCEPAVRNLSILLRLLKEAHTVLALDAYAGPATATLLMWADRLHKATVLLAPEPPPPAADLGGVKDHLAEIVARASDGKRLAVACMTKADAETLRIRIRTAAPGVTVGMVTGSDKELLSRPLEPGEDLQERFRVDVLIYTQAMATGVSIDLRDHFDEVHVVCNKEPGDAMLALQMYRRVRHPKDPTLHLSGPRAKRPRQYLLDYNVHLRRWERQDGSGAQNPYGKDLPPTTMAETSGNWTQHRRVLAALCAAEGFAWFAGATATGLRVLFGLPLEPPLPPDRPPSDKAERDQVREDRARAVALAEEHPEEATQEDVDEADRLCEVFGDDFRRGSRARRITLALADVSASKPATNRMLLFACVYLMAHGLGERVFDADGFLAAKWDIDHRKHLHRRAWLAWVLLDALGVTPAAAWGTQQDYGHREALHVVRLARGISRVLRLHGLPAPKPKDDAKPHQYVGRLLRQLDLDTVRSQRTVTAIDGTKARVSEYRVASASVVEQLRRAGHALRVLVGDHGTIPPDPLAPWSSAGSQPVPVLPPRPAGPPRPAVADLEAAFAPVGLEIDGERLRVLAAAYTPVPRRADSSAAILTHLRACAEDGRPLLFSAVFTTDHWPRRTPVWLRTPPPGVLLSPEQWAAVDREGAAYPANTPRELRAAISTPEGHTLVMVDLKAATLALLASMASDDAMAAWLAGDPHADTGAALAPSLDAAGQRALGKEVNSAMANSARVETIGRLVIEAGALSDLGPTTLVDFHAGWWARFPAVAALRARHEAEVAAAVQARLPVRIAVDGELVLAYPADLLSGERKSHGWPDTPEKRREKALRSSWAARIAALEPVVMDEVVLAAHALGLRMAMPMFDGMVWVAAEADAAAMASDLCAAVQGILDRRGIPTVGEVEVRRAWGPPIDL